MGGFYTNVAGFQPVTSEARLESHFNRMVGQCRTRNLVTVRELPEYVKVSGLRNLEGNCPGNEGRVTDSTMQAPSFLANRGPSVVFSTPVGRRAASITFSMDCEGGVCQSTTFPRDSKASSPI